MEELLEMEIKLDMEHCPGKTISIMGSAPIHLEINSATTKLEWSD